MKHPCFIASLLLSLYIAVPPKFIADYGLSHGWEGFVKTVPWYETYSVLCMMWIFGHFLLFLLLIAIYFIVDELIALVKIIRG